ncbi:LuxR C-terminal-related transcriptional regulator [Bilophila wadsworthia]|uniref:LuxR C-terminal-related transcriptional regulator n=1 Tax=Bilophila wadsworthia TaxID=35833 RepID=UPI003AABDC5B
MATVYWHLAIIRKIFGVHSNIELLHQLTEEPEMDMSTIQLTPRGREVFELVLHGLSIKEISERLGISYSGVLRHREKMLLVNKCASMLELIAKYHGTYTERPL